MSFIWSYFADTVIFVGHTVKRIFKSSFFFKMLFKKVCFQSFFVRISPQYHVHLSSRFRCFTASMLLSVRGAALQRAGDIRCRAAPLPLPPRDDAIRFTTCCSTYLYRLPRCSCMQLQIHVHLNKFASSKFGVAFSSDVVIGAFVTLDAAPLPLKVTCSTLGPTVKLTYTLIQFEAVGTKLQLIDL